MRKPIIFTIFKHTITRNLLDVSTAKYSRQDSKTRTKLLTHCGMMVTHILKYLPGRFYIFKALRHLIEWQYRKKLVRDMSNFFSA